MQLLNIYRQRAILLCKITWTNSSIPIVPPPDQAPEDAVEGSQDLEKVVEVPLTGTGLEDNKVGPESFDMITVLGQGSFGKSSILGEATPPAVVVLVLVKLWFGISRGEREWHYVVKTSICPIGITRFSVFCGILLASLGVRARLRVLPNTLNDVSQF
eukprot:sb/3473001/